MPKTVTPAARGTRRAAAVVGKPRKFQRAQDAKDSKTRDKSGGASEKKAVDWLAGQGAGDEVP